MSFFGDRFQVSMQRLLEFQGDAATYTLVDGSSGGSVNVLFNEFVGAVDNQARATFHISGLASNGITDPGEGDSFTLASGEKWYVVDVRDSKDDTLELRCDRSKTVNA